jgi:hypothetical protein
VPERHWPVGVVVGNQLRVWAISRSRGPREFSRLFLRAGYAHLPVSTPPMFRLEDQYDSNLNAVISQFVTFTNAYDTHFLLGEVFWCGCKFIAFTNYNIFTNFHNIFPTTNSMHSLPTAFRRMTMGEVPRRGKERPAGGKTVLCLL